MTRDIPRWGDLIQSKTVICHFIQIKTVICNKSSGGAGTAAVLCRGALQGRVLTFRASRNAHAQVREELVLPTNAATPFKGLQLGSMIGKGGYGRVYCGMYEGQLVAVKVPETLVGQRWVGRSGQGVVRLARFS